MNKEKSSDWLNELRTTSDQDLNLDANDRLIDNNPLEDDIQSDSPDWLNRIRDRKEIDDEFSKFTEQISQQEEIRNEPDQTENLIESFRNQAKKNKNQDQESSELISNFRVDDIENSFEIISDDKDKILNNGSDLEEEKSDQKDWLQRLPRNDESKQSVDDNPEIPGWIQNSNILKSNENLLDDDKKAEEIPDWISKFDSFDISDEEDDEESTIPEWINLSDSENSEISTEENDNKETIPDWIADTNSSLREGIPLSENQDTEIEATSFENTETEKENYPESDQNNVTGNGVLDQEKPVQESEQEDFEFSDFSLSDLPTSPQSKNDDDLVSQIKPVPDNLPLDGFLDQNGIPDWNDDVEISSESPIADREKEKNTPFIDNDQGISPGELPSWLKAMRPIEAFTPVVNLSENRKRIEKSGPLSGLRGVLSSEDVVNSISSPPSYSVNLNLSEKQRINAEILDQVLEFDTQPERKNIRTSKKKELITRLLVSFFLLVILSIAFLKENKAISLPDIFLPETVRFASISNGLLLSLETSPHILIIMDNEAASQAEVNLITRPVFERLMLKDSYLAIISSNPNANLVAMNVLSKASLNIPSYLGEDRISNFGYLPGGSTGIQNFLLNPRRSIPVGIFPEDIWNSSGLQDIYRISQFDSVILVTDNPENSKLWLEQIRINIPEMTILVAATAQASPLLQPYVNSEQIDGMISGLYGSISYSQLVQQENETLSTYWNMYKLGIFTFILIIIIGGLYYVISQFFKKSKLKTR